MVITLALQDGRQRLRGHNVDPSSTLRGLQGRARAASRIQRSAFAGTIRFFQNVDSSSLDAGSLRARRADGPTRRPAVLVRPLEGRGRFRQRTSCRQDLPFPQGPRRYSGATPCTEWFRAQVTTRATNRRAADGQRAQRNESPISLGARERGRPARQQGRAARAIGYRDSYSARTSSASRCSTAPATTLARHTHQLVRTHASTSRPKLGP
jgi:hypothetical protein